MKSLIAAASTAFQMIYVWSLLGFGASMFNMFQVGSLYDSGDPKLVSGAVSVIIMDLLIGVVAGFGGVLLAWLVLRQKSDRPSWFLPVSTFFAWAWIVFVPIGTVIGFFMLRWRRPESVGENATETRVRRSTLGRK